MCRQRPLLKEKAEARPNGLLPLKSGWRKRKSSSAADPEARGSAEAKGRSQPSRRVVLTYSRKEAKERDRILSTTAPKSLARRPKKKKEKKEKRARPGLTLRSVPREAQANRVLRSVSALRKEREGDKKRKLNKFLEEESAKFASQRFRERVQTQAKVRKFLPKGSVGDALLRKRTGEACSTCRSRRKAYQPVVRNYVLRRFAPEALASRIQEIKRAAAVKAKARATAVKGKAKPKAEPFPLLTEDEAEESTEEEDGGDGSGPDWDLPTSPDGAGGPDSAGAAAPAAVAAN